MCVTMGELPARCVVTFSSSFLRALKSSNFSYDGPKVDDFSGIFVVGEGMMFCFCFTLCLY